MEHTIKFSGVGRNKVSWNETLQQSPTEAILRKLVKRKKVLMSRDVDCVIEADSSGTIYAGMRAVGSFQIQGPA